MARAPNGHAKGRKSSRCAWLGLVFGRKFTKILGVACAKLWERLGKKRDLGLGTAAKR